MAVLLTVAAAAQQSDTARRAAQDSLSQDSAGARSVPVAEAYPGLLQLAKVPPAAAEQAALHKVKNGQLVSARIEARARRMVYVIRVNEPNGRQHELLVDAHTGRVLSNRKLPRN